VTPGSVFVVLGAATVVILKLIAVVRRGGGTFEYDLPDDQVDGVIQVLEHIAFGAQEDAGSGSMTIARLPGRSGRTRLVVTL